MNATTELFAASVGRAQPLGPRVVLDVVDEREVCSQRGDVLRRGQPQVEDDRARRQLDGAGREVAGAVQGHRPAVEPGALRRRGSDGQAGGDAAARPPRGSGDARPGRAATGPKSRNSSGTRPLGPRNSTWMGSLWMPRESDHSARSHASAFRAGARERVLGRGPGPERTRPERRVDAVLELPRLHGRARRRRQVAPVVLERRFDLDLPLAVERHLARRRRHDRSGGLAPHPPREQRARPVGEVQPHPHAALDRLARGACAGGPRTAPTPPPRPTRPRARRPSSARDRPDRSGS